MVRPTPSKVGGCTPDNVAGLDSIKVDKLVFVFHLWAERDPLSTDLFSNKGTETFIQLELVAQVIDGGLLGASIPRYRPKAERLSTYSIFSFFSFFFLC